MKNHDAFGELQVVLDGKKVKILLPQSKEEM